jgi:UV DNA damage endonuclease
LTKVAKPELETRKHAEPTETEVDAFFDGHIASRRSQVRFTNTKAMANKPKCDDDKDPSYSSSPGKEKRSRKVTAADDDEVLIPKKSRKSRPLKPEPVYVIPEVERRETTFKGRLGTCLLLFIYIYSLRNIFDHSRVLLCSCGASNLMLKFCHHEPI